VAGCREAKGNRETSGVLPILSNKFNPAEFGHILAAEYNIIARDGLLCAPLAHKRIGTYPDGVLRISVGPLTVEEEIEYTIEVIREIHR